ncbi:integrator complex subunit 6-like [Neolamprologus brichardi]|uniref:integrator complex subunit 6-like n=1 Tax=Neolamprologus brichardi TaxID=32507 RepID=UPI001643E351|nr:integrator complex subunit 6-like [Neolamprologus brichardi]
MRENAFYLVYYEHSAVHIQRFDSVDVLSLNRLNLIRFAFSVSDYEKIFLLLKQIQGTLDTRLIFLQNIIKEAARFKKRVLIEQLENFLEEIHNRATNMNHVDTF